jgi:hypothetical protein
MQIIKKHIKKYFDQIILIIIILSIEQNMQIIKKTYFLNILIFLTNIKKGKT